MSGDEVFKNRFNVSRETIESLQTYENLLKKWNPRINLVSRHTLDHIWERHFLDSAELLKHIPDTARKCVDFGSGGGFPGMILAILAKEKRTQLEFTCIEADIRKCAFLQAVARETKTELKIISRRIEQAPEQSCDVVSARALSSLTTLLRYSTHHLKQKGVCLFQKGKSWKEEVETARGSWQFDVESHPSATDEDAALLKISNVSLIQAP